MTMQPIFSWRELEANATAHPSLDKITMQPTLSWRELEANAAAHPANNIKFTNVMYQSWHGIDMSLNFTSDKWLDWRACVKI